MIATFLPRPLQLRLATFLDPRHTIVPVSGWASAMALLRAQHVDLVLADPTTEGSLETDMVIRLITEFPSVPVAVYTKLLPAAVSSIYKLIKQGLYEAIIYNFDDSPERLALLLEDLPSRRFLPAVMAALQPGLAQLPPLVRQRVGEVLEAPAAYRSVTQLAQSVNMSRPALYLLFQHVGLGSPGRLLVGARLARACVALLNPGISVQAAAAKVGWDDVRTLKRYAGRALRVSPAHLRQHGAEGDLVERLVSWIRDG